MPTLSDGTVLPSFLGVSGPRTQSSFLDRFDSDAVLIGEIVKIHAPTDESNVSKKFYEYDVLTSNTEGASINTTLRFRNCIMACSFGTPADFFRWQPRFEKQSTDGAISLNSRVLVQCLSKDSEKGVIIGAYKHPLLYTEKKTESAQTGPYLEFEYNGINIEIDGDGQLSLTRRGPTDNDGTSKEGSSTAGFKITVTKDGSAKFQSGDGDQVVELSHGDKKVNINATNGVILGGGEHLVLGDTYRLAEDTLLQQIMIMLTTIAAGMTVLSQSAAAIPITAHLQPGFDAIGIPLNSLIPSAFPAFFGQSATYLSKTNTTK